MRKARLILLPILGLPLSSLPAASAIECRAEVPVPRSGYWSWREIDGKRCWYQGRPGMSKAMLRWAPSEAEPEPEQEQVQQQPQPAATDGRSSEVWPRPSAPRSEELSFEERWPR